jgi:hypothetical protein
MIPYLYLGVLLIIVIVIAIIINQLRHKKYNQEKLNTQIDNPNQNIVFPLHNQNLGNVLVINDHHADGYKYDDYQYSFISQDFKNLIKSNSINCEDILIASRNLYSSISNNRNHVDALSHPHTNINTLFIEKCEKLDTNDLKRNNTDDEVLEPKVYDYIIYNAFFESNIDDITAIIKPNMVKNATIYILSSKYVSTNNVKSTNDKFSKAGFNVINVNI